MSRVARAHGFTDPIRILSRLESFGQPMEVKEPLELLRAGVVFHARGLLNTGAIQHNPDWIWPFWVERQYDPADDAFIPRAFSITHVNLTHRNWTAVGLPDMEELPIVDPRGLLTPFWDSWSLDAMIVGAEGARLIPSRGEGEQRLLLEEPPAVVTRSAAAGMELITRVEVVRRDGLPVCRFTATALSPTPAWLVLSLRPCNPEGVSFVHDIHLEDARRAWRVGRKHRVDFSEAPQRHAFSDYRSGDVGRSLLSSEERTGVHCRVGMATAAALFPLQSGEARTVRASIPLEAERSTRRVSAATWTDALDGAAPLALPDPLFVHLYRAALHTLVLHIHREVYPGPYTYRRFWFRDAAFILHAALCAGLVERAGKVLDSFPERQTRSGFFHSQEGEWDSNGEALWILERFCVLGGRLPRRRWRRTILRGARWIVRKRLPEGREPHSGLLPAGFSAEHLGPNDFYYWDDFWGIAGLRAASKLLRLLGDRKAADEFHREAERFLVAVEKSLAFAADSLGRPAMPAAPTRRLDAGSVGSLAAGYPLQIFPPDDPRLLDTARFLLERCLFRGGFYQDIIHSGINPYLTLHLAQGLLRAGDERALELVRTVAELASPTGQWPEAVHPRTLGGCMGDGQHVWAAAEWVLLIRNAFVREEGERLVIGSGIFPEWLDQGEPLSFGPAPTPFGAVRVEIRPLGDGVDVHWKGEWRGRGPAVEIRLPRFDPHITEGAEGSVFISRKERR